MLTDTDTKFCSASGFSRSRSRVTRSLLVISDTGFLQLNEVDPFFDLNIKLETHFDLSESFMVTLSGGVTNLFNSYQDDFDTGPMRDSDYVYGPALPRSFFLGLKFGKLH